MDLSQLRYVVEIAATASFTRAAERCFVTQSALSHQIAALEREIGQSLFVRSSRGVRLTEAGAAFLPHARAAVVAAASAREAAAAAAGTVTGTLRLGVIPTVTAVDVPALIAAFRAEYPSARVELSVGNSDRLLADVRSGDLDVALIGLRADVPPAASGVRVLARERLVAAVPPGHPLAGRRSVSLADLAGEVFADFPAGTSGRAQSDAAFAAMEARRDVAFSADSAELILGLVSAGLAISLLAPRVVSAASVSVARVDVIDGPERIEYAAWDDRSPRTVTAAFVSVVDGLVRRKDEAGPEESSEPAPSAS